LLVIARFFVGIVFTDHKILHFQIFYTFTVGGVAKGNPFQLVHAGNLAEGLQ
jgi:hypothetical protein